MENKQYQQYVTKRARDTINNLKKKQILQKNKQKKKKIYF